MKTTYSLTTSVLLAVTLIGCAYAADKPKPAAQPRQLSGGAGDTITKSCEQWQQQREAQCRKLAADKKAARAKAEAAAAAAKAKGEKVPEPPKCEGKTKGGEDKRCDSDKEFVLNDAKYGVEYQYSCNYDGLLSDKDRLAPHFRVDTGSGKTNPTQGKGYCVADYRARKLFEDGKACAQTGDGAGYGTRTNAKDEKTCKGGTVQFAGNFDDKLLKDLDVKAKCFQAVKKGGEAPKAGVVGDKISGFYGAGDQRVIIVCRDDQKLVEEAIRKQMDAGAIAYDPDKKVFTSSGAGDDTKKQDAAKATLKEAEKAGQTPIGTAVMAPDTKSKLDAAQRESAARDSDLIRATHDRDAAQAKYDAAVKQHGEDSAEAKDAKARLDAAKTRFEVADRHDTAASDDLDALHAKRADELAAKAPDEKKEEVRAHYLSTVAEAQREAAEARIVRDRPMSKLTGAERKSLDYYIVEEAKANIALNKLTRERAAEGEDDDVAYWQRDYEEKLGAVKPGTYDYYYFNTYLCEYNPSECTAGKYKIKKAE